MDETPALSVSRCRVREVEPNDAPAWGAMRAALWTDADAPTLAAEVSDYFAQRVSASIAVVALAASEVGDEVIGFAEATIRGDYVNGTRGSPVGFLEALFVKPERRRRGVGRALVAAIERWVRARGCSELALDADLDNGASHAAHRAYGFVETERVVYFCKRLDER
jgi:aminoglycoside 6'-N-acetyltransferase I